MRLPIFITVTSLSLAACGDDTNTTPDAQNNSGFNKPTVSLKANTEVSSKNWMELGPADLTCLNTPSDDPTTTAAVTLHTKVTDFQSGNAVPGATVTAFANQDQANAFDTQTSDGNAELSITIPAGTTRYGFKMTSGTSMPTLLLNQIVDPAKVDGNNETTNPSKIQSVSNATAATLPALIGQTRTPGTGVVAGALRDCQDREISGFVATMSSTPTTATPMTGSEAYYFSSSVGLPVHHNQAQFADKDGLFMIIQVPASNPTGYVQMWGYPTDAEIGGDMALIAELQVPVLADTVITGSYEPKRQ
jgi:hypothetical protein